MNELDQVATVDYYYNASDGSGSWYVYAGDTPRSSRYAPWNIQAFIAAENARAAAQALANQQWESELRAQIAAGGVITAPASPPIVPLVMGTTGMTVSNGNPTWTVAPNPLPIGAPPVDAGVSPLLLLAGAFLLLR